MIDLSKPLIDREPLELIEHTFYSLRLENDIIVQAMEKLQAAGAGLVELQEVAATEISPVSLDLTATSISRSLLEAYRQLEIILESHKGRITAFRSYLELYGIDVAGSMKELLSNQAAV
jgi:hypothetical protein